MVKLRVPGLKLATQRRTVLLADLSLARALPSRALIDLAINYFSETDPSRLRGRLATPKDAS